MEEQGSGHYLVMRRDLFRAHLHIVHQDDEDRRATQKVEADHLPVVVDVNAHPHDQYHAAARDPEKTVEQKDVMVATDQGAHPHTPATKTEKPDVLQTSSKTVQHMIPVA